MVAPGVTVNGHSALARRRADAHDGARLAPRSRAHRVQGGLRGGRVRRLLGAGRPAGTRHRRRHGVGRDQRLPDPTAAFDGQEVVTAEGLGRRRGAASGAARDGAARRLAVWLLHAWLHLQHGR